MSIDFFPVPMTELLFTQKCNMACTYCFERDLQQTRMTTEQIADFVESLSSSSIMMFGGEPFVDIELFIQLYDAIEAKQMDASLKKQLLESFTSKGALITNGTLIEKHLETIKKYNISLQISLDGPKELNDLQRVYRDGSGSYDDVMKAIDFCVANDISWSLHGALSSKSFPYLYPMFEETWNLIKRQAKGDLEYAINIASGNTFQFLFEDDYTDEDIDIFLKGHEAIFNGIISLPELNERQKTRLLQGWFCRHGSACIAGSNLLAVDADLDVYPCHRPGGVDRKSHALGNLKDRTTFKNFKPFNTFLALDKEKKMYSAIHNMDGNKDIFAFQQNWCPATNIETSGTVFYQSAKYSVLIAEYTRFVTELFEYAKIPLPNTN